jgi:Sec-independent protein translocase protein TatA
MDLSIKETLVIMLLALILVRPKDLPKILKKIRYIYRQIIEIYHTLISELNNSEGENQ